MSNKTSPVAIVGAGWAGLATAVELSKAGIPVNVFEAAATAGGRARDIPLKKISLDSGQHLLIGAYTNILETLQTVGVDTDAVFDRRPLSLKLQDKNKHHFTLNANQLPAPLHLFSGLLGKNGFSIKQRYQIAHLGLQLLQNPESIATQRTVQDWLGMHKQDSKIIKILWEPLCLATLNTPIKKASAKTFLRVLKNAFLYKKEHSNLLFSTKTLSKLFIEPCINFIKQNGGNVYFNKRVTELVIEKNKIKGLRFQDKGIQTDEVILAIPPNHCHSLVKSHTALNDLANDLAEFKFEPITTVYLQYPPNIQLEQPMMGLLDTCSQWVFDRRVCNQPGLMAVVISSSGPHMQLEREQLATLIKKEMSSIFPAWPQPSSCLVIREKRATFCCDTNVDAIRPASQTSLHGLWLAGDYTDTGYPATLEGAVQSGIHCAQHLVKLYK